MVFSSPTFVFYFLPLTLLLYYLSPRLALNGLLVAVSLIFYTWGAGKFTALLLLSVAVNYAFGLALGAIGGERLPLRRMTLAAGIVFNLAVLAYFKYANFFVFQLNDVGHRLEWGEIAWNNVILPIGISFYTFHAMSYVIDVFRQRVAPLRNPLDFALYITFFPQMIAGPIVRFNQIDEQIRRREETLDKFAEGVLRFVHGLIKKIIIADPLGVLANAAFSTPPDTSPCSRRGSGSRPIPSRSTSISPAIPTWQSGLPACSASASRRISTAPTLRSRSPISGGVGT